MKHIFNTFLFLHACCLTTISGASQELTSLESLPPELIIKYIVPNLSLSNVETLNETSRYLFEITNTTKRDLFLSLLQINRHLISNNELNLSENFGWKEGFYTLWHIGKFYMPYIYQEENFITLYLKKERDINQNSIVSLNTEKLLNDFPNEQYSDFIDQISLKKLYVFSEIIPDFTNISHDKNNFVLLNNVIFDKSNYNIYPYNSFDKYGNTALMRAADDGLTEIAQILIENGAKINAQNNDGNTALMRAALSGHTEIVQMLIKNGAEINTQNNDGDTALMEATYNGHTKIVQILIKNGAEINTQNDDGDTALMLAAYNGHTKIVQMLIDKSAEINTQNNDGGTALMEAALSGHTEIVQMLIDKSAEINTQNNYGNTALMWAALEGHTEIVQMLIDKGAIQ